MNFALTDDSIIDPEALVFEDAPFKEWSESPNGLSFQQEGLWSHAGWQYATWWDARWRLAVGRRKLPEGTWERIHFDDHRLERDDIHNVTVLGICSLDGTLHLSFDHHNNPIHYRVSRPDVASHPEAHAWTADLFGPVLRELPGTDAPVDRITYPLFFARPDGGLQLYFRTGGAGNGDSHLARYDASGWHYQGRFIAGDGDYRGSASRNAYLHGIGYDAAGRLHAPWCWRDGPGAKMPRTGEKQESGKMSNHDLCYASSDDGGDTWLSSTGRVVRAASGPDAIRIDSPGIAVAEIPMGTGLYNQVTHTVDASGRVHVIVPREDYVTYYHDWRDADGSWRSSRVPFRGVRPRLLTRGQGDLVLVYRNHQDGRLRIATALAADRWKAWSVAWESDTPFCDEPLTDPARWKDEGILSVYVQTRPASPGAPSPLRCLSFEAT